MALQGIDGRQSMLWCGIDSQFYHLGLGQVHLSKEVKSVSNVFQTETKQRFSCTLNLRPLKRVNYLSLTHIHSN